MQIKYVEPRTVLVADEGMIVTDGNNYGRVIYLPEGGDPSSFKEITEDEFEALRKEGVLS